MSKVSRVVSISTFSECLYVAGVCVCAHITGREVRSRGPMRMTDTPKEEGSHDRIHLEGAG